MEISAPSQVFSSSRSRSQARLLAIGGDGKLAFVLIGMGNRHQKQRHFRNLKHSSRRVQVIVRDSVTAVDHVLEAV